MAKVIYFWYSCLWMRIWQLLFLASLAALPVQLGKFFFIKDSYVLGLPIDYLAIAIYFSELVITALIVSYLWAIKSSWKKVFAKYRLYIVTGAIFVLYLFSLTVLTPPISPTGLYFDFKIAGLFLYSIIAAEFFSTPNLLPTAKKVLNFSLLWVSLLIIAEFALQRSLDLWFLGERSFDTSTSNIAHFNLSGHQLLRSYGTFSHPNVAGAFIVLYLILSTSFSKKISNAQKFVVFPLASIALLFTFSKAAIFALVIYILLTAGNQKLRLAIITALAIAAFFLVSSAQLIPVDSIAERFSLSQAALDITLKNPLFGIGPTNFIRELSKLNLFSISQTRLLQPVHNMFLIFLVETGIVGLLLFAAVLFAVASRATEKTKQALLLLLLCFGSIDHFFITIHQGQLLFWLTLGYIIAVPKIRK